jgi:opacity protein-like surface antigen
MKKVIFFFVAAFSMNVATFAQAKFGVKAGLNVSAISDVELSIAGGTQTLESSRMAAGFLVGASAGYAFSEAVGVQAEVAYSQQGGSMKAILQDGSRGDRLLRQSYINIPLLADIKPLSNLPLSVVAGPQAGFCIKRTLGGEKIASEVHYKTFDLSIAFGAQYMLTEHVAAGLRYNVGVTPSMNYEGTKGARNNVLQLSLGWAF